MVETRAGTRAIAHFNNYTAVIVYATSNTGDCSCICSNGNSATLVSASDGFGSDYGWTRHSDFVSFVYRGVYMNGPQNIVGFSTAYYEKFPSTKTATALATPGGHRHQHVPEVEWAEDSSKCIPRKIYGMVYGV